MKAFLYHFLLSLKAVVAASVCTYGLGQFGGVVDGNEFVDLAGSNHQLVAILAIAATTVAAWFGCRLYYRGAWLTLQAARVVLAVASTALVVVAVATSSLPRAKEYVDTLPVAARLLPAPDNVDDVVPLHDFSITRSCKTNVCSFYSNSTPPRDTCSVTPIHQSGVPLVVRHDAKHDLYYFDGMSQVYDGERAQLGFRHSDLLCVWPTELDLPDSVGPSLAWLLLSGLGIAVSLWAVWTWNNGLQRATLGLAFALLSIVPILPWLLVI